jgi:hypothetical protein
MEEGANAFTKIKTLLLRKPPRLPGMDGAHNHLVSAFTAVTKGRKTKTVRRAHLIDGHLVAVGLDVGVVGLDVGQVRSVDLRALAPLDRGLLVGLAKLLDVGLKGHSSRLEEEVRAGGRCRGKGGKAQHTRGKNTHTHTHTHTHNGARDRSSKTGARTPSDRTKT